MHFPPNTDLAFCLIVINFVLYSGTALLWAGGIFLWAKQRLAPNSQLPSVSVIVAARNEEALITDCLRSLLAQDYPLHLYEVIIVDDRSGDDTRRIADGVASNQGVTVKIVTAPPCPAGIGPKKNALAFGIAQSSGEILLFTDADCRVSTNWIRSLVRHYDAQTGAVAGATVPTRLKGILETLRWMERILVNYTAASAAGWGMPASVNGGNFSYRRTVFDQVGGIAHAHVSSGDDDLMAQAIARKGWRVRFAAGKDALVSEVRRPTAAQHLNATIRHQSTIQYYPWRWRLAYASSILSAVLFMACAGFAAAGFLSWLLVLSLFLIRAVVETPAVLLFTRRSGAALSFPLTVLGEILLPFYLILRPIAVLAPRYTWHGRTHQSLTANAAGGAG